jgi:hypothetical protein
MFVTIMVVARLQDTGISLPVAIEREIGLVPM